MSVPGFSITMITTATESEGNRYVPGSRSPGSAGSKDNQGDAETEDGGDPKTGFQVDLGDGHPTGVPPVDVPCDMSSSRVSRVIQPITRATERAFLASATINHWAILFEVKPTGKSSFPPVSVTCDKDEEEIAKGNVVALNEGEKELVDELEDGELSLQNHHRLKDMEECTFKDRQSSLVLGSSFGNLGFSDSKKILEDDSSSQHSICVFPDLDRKTVTPRRLMIQQVWRELNLMKK
ncbi:hypothetical protein SUGI_0264660 [Cryptomeria japonica]|nr:hypothetical protein SUGI_0264660 [Cryptomeria japonica]